MMASFIELLHHESTSGELGIHRITKKNDPGRRDSWRVNSVTELNNLVKQKLAKECGKMSG